MSGKGQGSEFVIVQVENGKVTLPGQWVGPDIESLNGHGPDHANQAAVPEVLDFDAHLARAIGESATAPDVDEAALAALRDTETGVLDMYAYVEAQRRAAERDANGEGTPLAEMPFDQFTKDFITRFLAEMNDQDAEGVRGASDTWYFYRMVESTEQPQAAAQPASKVKAARSWRRGSASPAAPATKMKPEIYHQVDGWDIGFVTNEGAVTTPGGRELWVGVPGTGSPERVVMDRQGNFYRIATWISPEDGDFKYSTRDRLPKSMPLGADGKAEGLDLGHYEPVQAMVITRGEVEETIPFAEFVRSTDQTGVRGHLVSIALRSLRPKAGAEAAGVAESAQA